MDNCVGFLPSSMSARNRESAGCYFLIEIKFPDDCDVQRKSIASGAGHKNEPEHTVA